jgi:hypothetical protein
MDMHSNLTGRKISLEVERFKVGLFYSFLVFFDGHLLDRRSRKSENGLMTST